MVEAAYIQKIRPRKKDGHKGDYGHVLILAGSVGMTGAAYLSSQAALLSGSGLVTLGIPASLNPIMEIKLTEVMTLPLEETRQQSLRGSSEQKILDFARRVDAVAIGPGLSQNKDTQSLIRSLVKRLDKPVVLDADGLNAYEGRADELKDRDNSLVITPHPGEMSRLAEKSIDEIQNSRQSIAKEASKRFNAVVVLKGFHTVIAQNDDVYTSDTGNPGMATGGVGDVLTGIIVSLIGQGLDPLGAAKLGCHVHGLAGDMAMREYGEISLTAGNILEYLPAAFKAL